MGMIAWLSWKEDRDEKRQGNMDDQQVIEILKSCFLFNFRTGNVMIDTFVTGLIIMISTYIFNMFNNMSKTWEWKMLFNWYVANSQGRNSRELIALDWSTQQTSLQFSIRSRNLTVSRLIYMSWVKYLSRNLQR